MEKKTTGKVQIVIGIILLIGGIIGLIYALSLTDNVKSIMAMDDTTNNYSLGEKVAIKYSATNIILTVEVGLASTSVLTLFLSLLFITQGLANKSEQK